VFVCCDFFYDLLLIIVVLNLKTLLKFSVKRADDPCSSIRRLRVAKFTQESVMTSSPVLKSLDKRRKIDII
jgi:hypothetical protein